MLSQKISFVLLTAGVSALTLSGCSVVSPNAMPSGYTYHHDVYKSPVSPPSSKVTVPQRYYMDAAQAEQFRDAVYGLLERLTNRAGMSPKPVYILAPDPMTTFYANIDNDLRESMRHIGYALADDPAGAYVFVYDANILERPRGEVSMGEPNVELVMKVFDSIGENARMLTEESGHYFIKGAEELRIQPSRYSTLPSREKIMNQARGNNAPVVTSVSAPRVVTDFSTPSFTPRVPQASDYASEPMQAVTIDPEFAGSASASSFGAPQVNQQPLVSRARVSRYVDY